MIQNPVDDRIQRENTYLADRWQNQKNYYSNRVSFNKTWHQRIRLFVGLTSVVIPVLLSLPGVDKSIPTLLSALVAVATVTEGVYSYGDNWRNFRQTLEKLKRERALYDARVEPYHEPETAFSLFVKNCESAIAQETGEYFQSDQDKK